MYCKYCGNKLDEQATYCSKCGKRVDEKIDFFDEAEINNSQEMEAKDSFGGSILGFAIAGLVFAVISLMAFSVSVEYLLLTANVSKPIFILLISFPLLGWIFALASTTKVKQYKMLFGETEKKATVGKHLALPAFIVNLTVLVVMIVITYLL